MAVFGLAGSLTHCENGMIESDMRATLRVADRYNEVIIFRSTGPWSRRWILGRYPTKNFHVKGKSSDWGPQAGFVPYLGKYSKVGHVVAKAEKGTQDNNKGISEGYAATTNLTLTYAEIMTQRTQAEEQPPRYALFNIIPMRTQPRNLILLARRSGDQKVFAFRAVYNQWFKNYMIHVYPDDAPVTDIPRLEQASSVPLKVMTSSEAGAHNRPMTGDYDLMAVCPTWRDYMARSTEVISKPAVMFQGKEADARGQEFGVGAAMDKVLDMRVNTGAVSRNGKTYQGFSVGKHNAVMRGETRMGTLEEHGDMGNLTPRILRCINALNAEMNPGDPHTPMRRVHHNAESHRHAMFGALKADEMWEGDGFPITGFHPAGLRGRHGWVYGDVATIETMAEFHVYVETLHEAGYQVPRNSTWQMSVRDRVRQMERRL